MSAVPPAPANFQVPCGEVALGDRRFDVRSRALVVGVLRFASDAAGEAARLVRGGADALEVVDRPEHLASVVDAVRSLEVPVAVDTSTAAELRTCAGHGAVAISEASGFADPELLPAAAELGASIVVTLGAELVERATGETARDLLAALAQRAVAAGVAPDRVIIDAGLDRLPSLTAYLAALRGTALLPGLGHPVAVSIPSQQRLSDLLGTDPADGTVAIVALAVALGCRVLRVADVRTARRAADVIAAVLAARSEGERR